MPTEAPSAAEAADAAGGPDEQSSGYTASITVTQPAYGTNLSEADEAAAPASQAKTTADQANAAALAANPGTTVVKTDRPSMFDACLPAMAVAARRSDLIICCALG